MTDRQYTITEQRPGEFALRPVMAVRAIMVSLSLEDAVRRAARDSGGGPFTVEFLGVAAEVSP